MQELLKNISSYNLFNNLFPGVLFAGLGELITGYKLVHKDAAVAAVICYFMGMVVSRIGTLTIEPLLRWTKFIEFTEYADFVKASSANEKIEILSEVNNTYRTICSMFLCLGVLKLTELTMSKLQATNTSVLLLCFIGLFLLFLFAYRKQTTYITKRINAVNSELKNKERASEHH